MDYIEAIEQKQIEKERVTTEAYKAEQAEYRKKATNTEAEGEAESIRIKAKPSRKTRTWSSWSSSGLSETQSPRSRS